MMTITYTSIVEAFEAKLLLFPVISGSLGLGFRIWGLGFGVEGLGFRVWGLGLVQLREPGFRV